MKLESYGGLAERERQKYEVFPYKYFGASKR